MVRVTRSRWFGPIIIALISVVTMTCSCVPYRSIKSDPHCGNGLVSSDKNHPVVCVESSGRDLLVYPDPVSAYDVQEASPHKRSDKPVMVEWYAKSAGSLSITVNQSGCLDNLHCESGHCRAKTIPGSGNDPSKACKYTVTFSGVTADPVIIIDPCCP
jgi:hypothetical protein